MKAFTKVTEVDGEGLESLGGENVLVFCMNYIYTGLLSGVNDTFIKLTGARLVFETGAFNTKDYKDAQTLPGTVWYINRSAIESFGLSK